MGPALMWFSSLSIVKFMLVTNETLALCFINVKQPSSNIEILFTMIDNTTEI